MSPLLRRACYFTGLNAWNRPRFCLFFRQFCNLPGNVRARDGAPEFRGDYRGGGSRNLHVRERRRTARAYKLLCPRTEAHPDVAACNDCDGPDGCGADSRIHFASRHMGGRASCLGAYRAMVPSDFACGPFYHEQRRPRAIL